MYIKLDDLDAQSLALQSMLGVIKSQHIVRQAINADAANDDKALLVLEKLVARARDTLDFKQKVLSPFGTAIMRDLVAQSPAFIESLKTYGAAVAGVASSRNTALQHNIHGGLSALRMSVEQARSVINYIDGKPLELEEQQISALYSMPRQNESPAREEVAMR